MSGRCVRMDVLANRSVGQKDATEFGRLVTGNAKFLNVVRPLSLGLAHNFNTTVRPNRNIVSVPDHIAVRTGACAENVWWATRDCY